MTVTTNLPRGLLFVVAAPSGAGKTSLVNELVAKDNDLSVSVSHTTRPMRPGERNGVDYNFVDRDTFGTMIAEGRFLEHATVFGNLYGTCGDWVEARLADGEDLILEIDWQGARQIRERYTDVHDIFIIPPNFESLRHRLTSRGKDGPDIIEQRLAEARSEMSHYAEFRYLVVNDDFQHALIDLQAILRAARLGLKRQQVAFADALENLLTG